jgi:hypothetical protein
MRTWSVDTEYGFRGEAECESGFVPILFCGLCLETGERVSFWGRDPGLSDFIEGHRHDLFVSHNLMAEVKYLLRLHITPPESWWDTMVGFRYVTNAQAVVRFGLVKALARFGIPYALTDEKEELQQRLGSVSIDADSPDERRRVRGYCFEDCLGAGRLYLRLVGKVPAEWMRSAATFCVCLARMELRGIGIDLGLYGRLLERRGDVVRFVTGEVNSESKVFVGGSLNEDLFFRWCVTNGIGWPKKVSPRTGRKYLSLERRTFERMKDRHPFLKNVHEANKTAKQLTDRSLAVDWATGRHYFGNIPFAMATGRTSFRGFLLSSPKWMRFLAVPRSPEHVLVSADFSAEEILIAAHLSSDPAMAAAYRSGDPHWAFAVRADAANEGATGDTRKRIRSRYKAINLGVNYGQTAFGVAENTGLYYQDCRALLKDHRRIFSRYWPWAEGYTRQAFQRGRCRTVGGWPRIVRRTDNPRSVANFPVQGTGGDIMRVATVQLSRHGLHLLATNHDGFLMECLREDLHRVREAVDCALSAAVNRVLPGAPMRWTFDVFQSRYEDSDGRENWEKVLSVLDSSRKGVCGVP